jgi:orotidine-5'-phosphate decarboxylase
VDFFTKLGQASARNNSLLCVGLDPDLDRMPVRDIAAFNREIISATSDLVCAYKPNLAFFEAQGIDGLRALEATLAAVPAHIPVIGDAKRGDIGHTAAMYARALFDEWGFDACTVTAWGGQDSLEPFIAREDKGIFVWCRSSNPGAADLQDLMVSPGESGVLSPLFLVLARLLRKWDRNHNLALVVGATFPRQLAQVRSICPEMTVLLPGIGAQGGEIAATMQAGLNRQGQGLIVAASRQVLYASAGADFAGAARSAAAALRDEINRHRPPDTGEGSARNGP